MDKLNALIHDHLVIFHLLIAISAVQLIVALTYALIFNHNFGLLIALAGLLTGLPRNLLTAIVIKYFFLKDEA